MKGAQKAAIRRERKAGDRRNIHIEAKTNGAGSGTLEKKKEVIRKFRLAIRRKTREKRPVRRLYIYT